MTRTLCVFADGSTEAHEIDPAAEIFVAPWRGPSVTTLDGFWRCRPVRPEPVERAILSRFHMRLDLERFAFFAEGDLGILHLRWQVEAVRALAALISGLRGTLVG